MRRHEGHDPMIPSGATMNTERDDAVERLKSFIKDDASLDWEMVPPLLADVDLLAESPNQERVEQAELAAADPLTALANALNPIIEYQRNLHNTNVANHKRIEDVIKRDFAAEEDLGSIDELTPLEAYKRGVMDVQERLLLAGDDT